MKKKIGILTINDYNNYGNRLQNYATQKFIENNGYEVCTIENKKKKKFRMARSCIGYFLKLISNKPIDKRYIKFLRFSKKIRKSKFIINEDNIPKNLKNKYDYFITGSDQVWNPHISRLSSIDLLNFADNSQKISFSASFGISELPNKYYDKVKKELSTFKAISVREEAGKKIIEHLTKRADVKVLVDPTMLLTSEEWDKVAKKPRQLKSNRYILNYFLGELSQDRKKEIERVANENNCEIINILDVNSPLYKTGPSEFLYLEKNAFLICTDSFHSSVFAILYNRPFVIFDREDKHENMNSRIETLITKFELNNRMFTGKIIKENLQCDYSRAYEILENERIKSLEFLKSSLN